MKVENPQAHASPSVAPVGVEKGRTAPKSIGMGSDSVRLSDDLRLASAVMKAADPTGDVRADAVAEARALLERGELGQDLEGLADAIIDAMTYSYDDPPA